MTRKANPTVLAFQVSANRGPKRLGVPFTHRGQNLDPRVPSVDLEGPRWVRRSMHVIDS